MSLDPPPSPIAAPPAQVVSCTPEQRADSGYRRKGVAPPGSELDGAPHLGAADCWPFVGALGLRSRWLAIGGAGMGLFGMLCGLLLWKSGYTSAAQLIRYDSPTDARPLVQAQRAKLAALVVNLRRSLRTPPLASPLRPGALRLPTKIENTARSSAGSDPEILRGQV